MDTGHKKPPNAGMGRKKGVPNKATREAREAIAAFVEGNIDRLQEWLDAVAKGVKRENSNRWLVTPNPTRAFELFQSVIEFHIPKLQRSDLYARVETTNTRLTYAEERALEAAGAPGLAERDPVQRH